MNPENNEPLENQTPSESSTPSPLKQIRTFQGDVAEAISHQKESIYSIHEKERVGLRGMNVSQQEEKAPQHKNIFLLLLGSIVLIGLTGFGSWYTYQEFVRKTSPPIITAPDSRFISTESSVVLNITPLSREALISATQNESAKVGGLRHIILKDGESARSTSTSPTTFFNKLGSQAPGSLLRAFEPVFMLGLLGESRFMIFKLRSFENAFAGMLAWEQNMAGDLRGLFGTDQLGGFTSNPFKDVVYQNKDVRALVIEDKLILLYTFFDNQTLIVTEDLDTLSQLSERLLREKLSR
jgi:hypothetical protein